jgi:hypothetical protein
VIYLLERRGYCDYEELDEIVVRAASRRDARKLAAEEDKDGAWRDPKQTKCRRVAEEGPDRVVCCNYRPF